MFDEKKAPGENNVYHFEISQLQRQLGELSIGNRINVSAIKY